jgi:hypothetical protein
MRDFLNFSMASTFLGISYPRLKIETWGSSVDANQQAASFLKPKPKAHKLQAKAAPP